MFFFQTALFLTVTVLLAPIYFFLLLLFYPRRRIIGPKLLRFYSKICLLIYRVRIDRVKNYGAFKKNKKGFLIISNHSSFLDIFALSALFSTVFVSKTEVMHYPIIGQIAWLMGVVFFDRSSFKERLRVVKTVAGGYRRSITVFPQGTTGSITERLPFNRGIFKVMELNPETTLLPVTLFYKDDADIAWCKPQTLKENAKRVSRKKMVRLKVIIHDPVSSETSKGKTTADICKMTEEIVLGPLQKEYREA